MASVKVLQYREYPSPLWRILQVRTGLSDSPMKSTSACPSSVYGLRRGSLSQLAMTASKNCRVSSSSGTGGAEGLALDICVKENICWTPPAVRSGTDDAQSYRFLRLRRRRRRLLLGGHRGLAVGTFQVTHTLRVLPSQGHEGLQVLQAVLVLRVQPYPVLVSLIVVQGGLDAHGALAPLQSRALGRSLTPLTHHQHGGAADQPDGAGVVVVLLGPNPATKTSIPPSVSVMVWTEHIVDLPEHSSTRSLLQSPGSC